MNWGRTIRRTAATIGGACAAAAVFYLAARLVVFET
jgi:hypothetical protein